MQPGSVRSQLDRLLAERILVIDGAMGTMLQAVPLGEGDFRGERFRDHPRDLKGNNEILVLTRPGTSRMIAIGTYPRPAVWHAMRNSSSAAR